MSGDEPLTPGEMLSRTGLEREVLAFWLKRDLIRTLPRERGGKHRRFRYYEANIAAIMVELRNYGLNIEALTSISSIYRRALNWLDNSGVARDDLPSIANLDIIMKMKERGDLEGDREAEMLDAWKGDGIERINERIIKIYSSLNIAEYRIVKSSLTEIVSKPTKLYDPVNTFFWRSGSEWRSSPDSHAARQDGLFTTIAIDIDAVLFHVWNKP